ncbi:MAG TPA: ATP-binding protein [Nostocaceae cyanobacterium]|nr:ATP-binding protein [Nostocaceae cyanobacterium]
MTYTVSPNGLQTNIQHLYTELARIRELLNQYIQRNSSAENSTISISESITSSTLNQLCYLFQLSPFERDILLLCLGMELDPNFEKLCIEAQGNPQRNYPTFALAFIVFPQVDFGVLSSRSPLLHWQLIEVVEGATLTQSPLRLDRRILCYLLEQPEIDSQLSSVISPIFSPSYPLPPSHQNIAEQIITTWSQRHSFSSWPVVQLCGTDITTKQAIVASACQQTGFGLRRMSAEFLPTNPDECNILLRRWYREAILTNSVLFLECDYINLSESIRLASLAQFIEGINGILIISSQERLAQRQRSIITYDVPSLSYEEQLNIWYNHLGESATLLNGHLETIVSQFNLPAATIQAACLQFQNQDKEDLANQIWYFCRTQARPKLDDLAQRIESNATWDDLILPEREKLILKDIATHLRHRTRVYQDWGFAQKSGRGLGITALFHGQSGTGKTLAAEVLAREFGLDLYRIDLSATVSKYIGETEKNLRRIFDAAETGGAVLLFDEADAIFGKRTEVKDSHDRHANVEVAYLLQRMEAYQGLAILTTNLKDSLDQAFTRRIRFIVQFPFPDAKARTEIWQRAFPAITPKNSIDFDKLAKLNVSGGNIRSIALNAAFLAAESDQPLSMSHLVVASQREYMKMGRSLTEIEFKGWV